MSAVSRETAAAKWPAGLPLLDRYHEWLATAGVQRGLIGPREVERLWDRHLLNSALLGELVPNGVSVIDVGSGAGLPGLPLAIVRPDLRVVLLEPLARRVDFLNEVVTDLGLSGRVQVRRARAEEVRDLQAEVVTARAVAPLLKLVGWAWGLVSAGGQMLLLKGDKAEIEIADAASGLRRKSLTAEKLLVGAGSDAITVVRVTAIGAQAKPNGTLPPGKGTQ